MHNVSTTSTDPLLETQMFWVRHKSAILGALLAIIVAIAAYGAYRFYSARKDAAAARSLASAKTAADYQKVISEHGSSASAPAAALLLAAEQRKEQKFVEANSTLQSFLRGNPKHQLATTAKMAMAGNLDAMGKSQEAIEMYRRLAADHPRSFNAPLALLAQVPFLKQKGQIEEARRVCETVLSQYGETYASAEASRYLRALKPAATPVASEPDVSPAAAPTP